MQEMLIEQGLFYLIAVIQELQQQETVEPCANIGSRSLLIINTSSILVKKGHMDNFYILNEDLSTQP